MATQSKAGQPGKPGQYQQPNPQSKPGMPGQAPVKTAPPGTAPATPHKSAPK